MNTEIIGGLTLTRYSQREVFSHYLLYRSYIENGNLNSARLEAKLLAEHATAGQIGIAIFDYIVD